MIAVTDAIGDVPNNTFDPTGTNIQRQTLDSPNGPTPTNRNSSGNVPLELLQTRCDEVMKFARYFLVHNTAHSGKIVTPYE